MAGGKGAGERIVAGEEDGWRGDWLERILAGGEDDWKEVG
jgi:hypothetical protein